MAWERPKKVLKASKDLIQTFFPSSKRHRKKNRISRDAER